MPLRKNLEDIVFEHGLTDILRLERAKQEAESRNIPLAATLIDLGFVEQRALAELVAEVTGLALIEPLPDEDSERLRDRLPSPLARAAQAIPIALNGTRLTVAMLDPTSVDDLEALASASGLTIEPSVAIRGPLEALVDRLYPPDSDDAVWSKAAASPTGRKTAKAGRAAASSSGSTESGDVGAVVTTAETDGDESTAPRGARAIRPLEMRVDRLEERVVDIVRILADVQARLDAIEARLRRLPNS